MKHWILAPVLAAFAAGTSAAPLGAQDAAAETLSARIEAVLGEYDAERDAFGVAYRAAETEEERERLIEELYPQAEDYCVRLMEITSEDPADAGAVRALVWVLQQTDEPGLTERAAADLLAHHIDSEGIVGACAIFERRATGGRAFLEQIAERSQSAENRARASYSLALHLLTRAAQAEELAQVNAGGDFVVHLEEDPASLRAEAESILVEVAAASADVAHGRGTLGAACASQLFELRNLQVGMTAPDIAGDDLDGVAFKLSDYRGKVVVLDFWGNW